MHITENLISQGLAQQQCFSAFARSKTLDVLSELESDSIREDNAVNIILHRLDTKKDEALENCMTLEAFETFKRPGT